MGYTAWRGFQKGSWHNEINVQNFIQNNFTAYNGDESFLSDSSERTKSLWNTGMQLIYDETLKGGVLDVDTSIAASITSFAPGYIDEKNEVIMGLQTDMPLKRSICPYGGIRMAKQACEQYGYKISENIEDIFQNYVKTHNDGVFSVYTPEMKKARKSGVITGLPDAYGRGRIIGDYRRVALYGVNRLIEQKQKDLSGMLDKGFSEDTIRLYEEVSDQIKSLTDLITMAASYGFDISRPAENAFEAVQWTYFAFLGAVKETNGAANSLGRVSNFFDIYIERDFNEGKLTEIEAQELIDQFVIKLRFIRHLRTPAYNELFAGDPVWITESIGGITEDGRHMVTKTSYRFLRTLINLGPAPEPNITVLWSEKLPGEFKKYCAGISMITSAIQYENDDLMKPHFGDDYGISCCVSAMRLGKQMQYFGARCNLPKLLLFALNGGRDELTGDQVAPDIFDIYPDEYLDYDRVMERFQKLQKWLVKLYVDTLNVIHYMHDKYAYERLMMALHDTDVSRFMAFGIAGLSVVADSLSAIKHARVRAIKGENGLITDFKIEGSYPQFGNDDNRVDDIAVSLVKSFYSDLKDCRTYRNAKHTLSILTITSNIVYGKKTGATPDGRKFGEAFAPGANPVQGRDKNGALAVLNSIAKIPYEVCKDGISLTLTLIPPSLGRNCDRVNNLAAILDGYFAQNGHHVNINVLDRKILEEAMEDPYNFPQLTIRVSGYAVNFISLSRAQQLEVISRTFHSRM